MTDSQQLCLSVTDKNALKAAKQLKKIIEQLFDKDVVISRTAIGDFHLICAAAAARIDKGTNITVTASTAELLSAATYAVLREFLGSLPAGTTSVVYQQEQRILMIDMARKYFSKDLLLKFIDSMSLAQFNYLQLHFSENEGFRIASDVAPEIVSPKHLTKEEMREVILYAEQAGIEIIPDFDSPGHLKQILQTHPGWQLQKRTAEGTLARDPAALNICDPKAVNFILEIYREYADLFARSTYFHIGGDEFVDFDQIEAYPELRAYAKEHYGEQAEGIDTFVAYVNQVSAKLNEWGFVPRIWNDGFFRVNRSEQVQLSSEVEITYWTKWNQNMAPVDIFIEKGYTVLNFNDNYFYYVLGENASYTYPTYEKIISDWTPDMYPQQQIMPADPEKLPGVAVAIWSDIPEAQTAEEVWQNVSLLLFAVLQKLTGQNFAEKPAIEHLLQTYFN